MNEKQLAAFEALKAAFPHGFVLACITRKEHDGTFQEYGWHADAPTALGLIRILDRRLQQHFDLECSPKEPEG